MKRLLVTGGAGFIGANFVHYWLAHHPRDRVVVLDALTYAGNLQSLQQVRQHPQFRFVQGNILDSELVATLLRSEQLDTIVHFAAESHVDRSIVGPDAFIETNIAGTHSLLKAARCVWLAERTQLIPHRFHHVSTDEVYGSLSANSAPFTETSVYHPNSPYAASKAAADHLVRAYYQTYGLKITISNCSNNYGYYQFPEKLIPLCITNILQGKPIPVYGDGHQIRDWLSVEDHCRGLELVLQRGEIGDSYNIGGLNEWRNIDTVTLLCELLDEEFALDPLLIRRFTASPYAKGQSASSLITHVTDRAGHDRRYGVDCQKIITELGFSPRVRFVDGVQQTIRWYLNNQQWLDSFSVMK